MLAIAALADHTEHWLLVIVSAGGTGTILKTLNYVSKQMPPLPPNAGWWTTLAYQLVKGASFHDPTYNAPLPVKS